MGESSLLKGALFFLCMILVVVLFMPKNCATKSIASLRALRAKPEPKGLRIESTTPDRDARPKRPIDFPAGLDAARVQYLIEVDPKFASPLALPLTKQGVGDARLVDALNRRGYLQRQPDGSVTLTSDALNQLDTLTDTGNAWMIPVARRAFVRLDSTTNCGSDSCTYLFVWKWEPNAVGNAMNASSDPRDGIAVVTGGEHHWGVTDLQRIDQNL